MAQACIKLGDFTSAIKYLESAKTGFIERKNGPDDWDHDLEMIDKKLAKFKNMRLTHHSTGLARKAAQAGEFKRYDSSNPS